MLSNLESYVHENNCHCPGHNRENASVMPKGLDYTANIRPDGKLVNNNLQFEYRAQSSSSLITHSQAADAHNMTT